MSRGTSLVNRLKAASSVLLGNGLYLVLGFLANLLVVNTLTPGSYGRLSVALAAMTILQEVCGGGLDVAMVRFTAKALHEKPEDVPAILRSSFWLKLAANSAVSGLLWFLASPIATYLLLDPELTKPLRWAAVGVFGSSLFTFTLSALQAQERFFSYALYRCSTNVLKLALIWWLVRSRTLDLSSALFASTALFLVSYAIGFAFFRPAYILGALNRESWQIVRTLVGFGVGVAVCNLLFNLYARLDLMALQRNAVGSVPYYAVASNLTFLMDLATYSVMVALLPESSRLKSKLQFRSYIQSTAAQCLGFAICMLPLFFFAGPLIRTLFSTRYITSIHIFRILFWGPFVSMLVYPMNLVLYARNAVGSVIVGSLVQLLVAGTGYSLLTAKYGAEGTAWSAVAGRLIGCLTLAYLVFREMNRTGSNAAGGEESPTDVLAGWAP